jgi:two-component system, OmpR family, response regulator MtrA
MKVLVVEDDADISSVLTFYFEAKGHEVVIARDGLEALERLACEDLDLMLLDVMLPKLDGWAVLEAVRAKCSLPVILLTALGDTEDIVKGLSLGADDYLRKPFEIRELEARIHSVTRRLDQGPASALIMCGHIRIDDRAKVVTVDAEQVALSPKEYELLKLLAREPGRVFTNDEIINHLWDDGSRATSTDVKQYIYHLRNKIERDPQSPQLIQNVKGFGYKLGV